ncbi:MAG: ABC transporter substrate-binding protein [Oscillospiraceae bacterium]|jgi:iron complex transport system substrate-binding protein|nr:ABC transporter substrate-binding protein [Oscillospiraceae bacterium]
MKKLLALILALALSLGILASCAGNSPSETPPPLPSEDIALPDEPSTEPDESEPLFFTDSAGRTVELPANITSISPSGALAQMFLIAIAPDYLVTIASEYSEEDAKYIPGEVVGLPVVGQFYGSDDLNFESIAAIGPELVIDVGEPKNTIVEDMDSITANLAIPSVHITATLDSTPDAFRTLGAILGREERGEELAQFCEKILAQTDEIMAQIGDNKVSALYLLGDAGLNVLAKTSFHSEVLDKLTDNLAVVDEPSSRGSGNETDLEQISLWNPQVILFAPGSVYADVASDPTWSQLDAIKNRQYYEVPQGPYNWMGTPPSINRYLGMIWLTQILYPVEAQFGVFEEVQEYYKLFYGYDLTNEEFESLSGLVSIHPILDDINDAATPADLAA